MKIVTIFIFFLFLSVSLTFANENGIQFREFTDIEQETFDILKKKFPGEILDANLKTLHELAESPEYKNFLKKAYPDAIIPPEFIEFLNSEGPLIDDILYKIRPPKKQYMNYYREYFGVETADEVTDTEHFIVHYEITGTWIYLAKNRGGDSPIYSGNQRLRLSSRASAKIRRSLQFEEMIKHRRWGIGIEVMRNFEFPLFPIAERRLANDTRWIHTLFEDYGHNDGILRVALQKPMLLSKLRYVFATDTALLRFIYTDPADAEAAERAKSEKRARARYGERKQTEQ